MERVWNYSGEAITCPVCKSKVVSVDGLTVGDPIMCICKRCGSRFPLLSKFVISQADNSEDDTSEDDTSEDSTSDPVNSPSHYTGNIECIDYLRDKLTPEEFTGFCMGNVLKYSSRWRKKDGLQDLKKAKVYLDWAIENEERGQNDD